MSTLTITIILVYVASVLLCYIYTNLAHSKRGIYSQLEPKVFDVIITFIPLYNTIWFLLGYLLFWPIKIDMNYSKFFKIKH